MGAYIVNRILLSIPTLLFISLLVFGLTRLSGDPLTAIAGPGVTPELRDILRRELQLDKPIHVQYADWLWGVVRGDFGKSLRSGESALGLYFSKLPNTMILGLVAVTWGGTLGIGMGILSALNVGKPIDLIGKALALSGQAIPAFWLGLTLMLVFAVWLGWFPAAGMGGPSHYVLPGITLGAYFVAAQLRVTRGAMIEVLGADYVRMARAKGVPEYKVIMKHAFRNALIPIVTLGGMNFFVLVTGAVITETVFAWPGVGRLLVDAIFARDFPVIQANLFMTSVLVLIVNLIIDITYTFIEPRIRYG